MQFIMHPKVFKTFLLVMVGLSLLIGHSVGEDAHTSLSPSDGSGSPKKLHCGIIYGKSDDETLNSSSIACQRITRFDVRKLPKNMTLEEFDHDDKCYYQCLYRRLDLLGLPDEISKLKIKALFEKAKERTPHSLIKVVMSYWTQCVDDALKIAQHKNFPPCKALALHGFCTSIRRHLAVKECARLAKEEKKSGGGA